MKNSWVKSPEIIASLEDNGFKAGIVSIARLKDVRQQVNNLLIQKLFNKTFYNERLANFDFDTAGMNQKARSIIIATILQPIIRVKFQYRRPFFTESGKMHCLS